MNRVLVSFVSIFVGLLIILPLYLFGIYELVVRFPLLNDLQQITILGSGNIRGLNLIGFVLPLSITIVCTLTFFDGNGNYLQSLKRNRWYLLAAILATALSFFIPGLITLGHPNYVLLLVVVYYIADNLDWKISGRLVRISFILGFLTGVVTDLQSSIFFAGYFGGFGWSDGDLAVTISLAVSVSISLLLLRFVQIAQRRLNLALRAVVPGQDSTPLRASENCQASIAIAGS